MFISRTDANDKDNKTRRNQTVWLTDEETACYSRNLLRLNRPAALPEVVDKTICQDTFAALRWLSRAFFDLLFADPPYNLTKQFNEQRFQQTSLDEYEIWLESWLGLADADKSVQGYADNVFWERNTLNLQGKTKPITVPDAQLSLL